MYAFFFRTNYGCAKKGELFDVGLTDSQHFAPSLIVALGGSAWPQAGATDAGYKLARQFGHKNHPYLSSTSAAYDAFQLEAQNLSGIALPVTIRCNNKQFTENMLFTHKGISGPVVLQISAHWKKAMQ